MRLAIALLTFICLAACSVEPTHSEHALVTQATAASRDEQIALDTQAILDGMAQARRRAELLARTARQPGS